MLLLDEETLSDGNFPKSSLPRYGLHMSNKPNIERKNALLCLRMSSIYLRMRHSALGLP